MSAREKDPGGAYVRPSSGLPGEKRQTVDPATELGEPQVGGTGLGLSGDGPGTRGGGSSHGAGDRPASSPGGSGVSIPAASGHKGRKADEPTPEPHPADDMKRPAQDR